MFEIGIFRGSDFRQLPVYFFILNGLGPDFRHLLHTLKLQKLNTLKLKSLKIQIKCQPNKIIQQSPEIQTFLSGFANRTIFRHPNQTCSVFRTLL